VCQTSSDSLIGAGVVIGDKTNIKNCVIGEQCVLATKVKLTNCVVMDHVNIEQGQVLAVSLTHIWPQYSADSGLIG